MVEEIFNSVCLYTLLGVMLWEIRHLRMLIEDLVNKFADKADTEEALKDLYNTTDNHEHRITIIETEHKSFHG